MKYAVFNKQNKVEYVVVYDGDTTNLPKEYVDVTNVKQKFNARDKEGNFIFIDEPLELEALKTKKITELNTYINNRLATFLSKYPTVEQESFPYKKKEAMMVKADENISIDATPVLTSLVEDESIEQRNLLANAVLQKVAQLTALEKLAVLTRDKIKEATTLEELEAIVWE